jgi:hypothetical protein
MVVVGTPVYSVRVVVVTVVDVVVNSIVVVADVVPVVVVASTQPAQSQPLSSNSENVSPLACCQYSHVSPKQELGHPLHLQASQLQP